MVGAKKSFGQHFLRDASVVEKIIDAARPEDFALIVEVGPGTGVVTRALEKSEKEKTSGKAGSGFAGKSNLALVEADRDLIPSLTQEFPEAKIFHADAAQVDYAAVLSSFNFALSAPWLLVGNLPYNAANAIIMHALQSPHPPARMVVMVQKEVGERLLGLPGSRGLLTVAAQLYAAVERVCTVKPGAFVPPPKVDSMVLALTRNAAPVLVQPERVIALAKAGFANRRKQLHKNLADAGVAPSLLVKTALKRMGLPELARAEELSLAQWQELVKTLQ